MKEIQGFEDYFVTITGKIYSSKVNKNFKEMKPYISQQGYKKVGLLSGKKQKSFFVHRLVAKAFILNNQNKDVVNHKDGHKLNNHVDNLEWCSVEENAHHAQRTGLCHNNTIIVEPKVDGGDNLVAIKSSSKIRLVGNSWMVTINKVIAEYEGYKPGDEVEIHIEKK